MMTTIIALLFVVVIIVVCRRRSKVDRIMIFIFIHATTIMKFGVVASWTHLNTADGNFVVVVDAGVVVVIFDSMIVVVEGKGIFVSVFSFDVSVDTIVMVFEKRKTIIDDFC